MERLREFNASDALNECLGQPTLFAEYSNTDRYAILQVALARYFETYSDVKQQYAKFIQQHTGQTPEEYFGQK